MAENKTPEFEPPQACVQRVIKSVLPDNVQIGKDAKAAFSRSAGIFIMYLTACANDFCREAKRQTISAQDVMQAIKELEFGELEEPLKEYLDQYRREASAKKQSKAAMGAAGPAAAKKEEAGGDMMEEPDADDGEADGVGGDDAAGAASREGGVGSAAASSAAAAAAAAASQQQPAGAPGGVALPPAAAPAPTGMGVEQQAPSETPPPPQQLPPPQQQQLPPPQQQLPPLQQQLPSLQQQLQQPPAAQEGPVPMDEEGAAPAPLPTAVAGVGESVVG